MRRLKINYLAEIFRSDYISIYLFLSVVILIIFSKKYDLWSYLIVAFVMSFIWMLIAKDEYSYNQPFLVIYDIHLFPLFGWTVALFYTIFIYLHFERFIKFNFVVIKVVIFSFFCWIMLIAIEMFGYHCLDIKNVAAQSYEAIPFCNSVHAPRWMQLVYFLFGPVYFIICNLLKFKNPYLKNS